MMDQMDVDQTTSSSSKRPATPSSSANKRPKLPLPDGQLATLNFNINIERKRWNMLINAAEANEYPWLNILLDVLMHITLELASTDMNNNVIANLTFSRAKEIVKAFKEDQLEAWKAAVQNGVKNNDWIDLIMRPELKIPNIAPMFVQSAEQEKATRVSWEREYIGQAAEALWTHIWNHYDRRNNTVYAHFCSIVQSSGMGKSRTVDELGKNHFSIPINLRDARSTGYPPADHKVRDFLTLPDTETQSYRRACCFIDALFQHTDNTLKKEFDSRLGMDEVAREFRIRMTSGQTMKEHNEFRRGFYQEVVGIAKNLMEKYGPPGSDEEVGYMTPPARGEAQNYEFRPAASCHNLVESLKARKGSSISGKTEDDFPPIILAFDEVHTLTNREEATWSNFSVLRHVLRALYGFPLFALFLSTTGKISRFTSPVQDTSKRIAMRNLSLIQPFTDLGFDTLATQIDLRDGWDLEHVTADAHIVHMGRPLFGSRYDAGDRRVQEDIVIFGVAKLLNADPNDQDLTNDQMLACLSQRLPMEFNSTTYISQTAESRQVEGHMRVCLKVDAAFETMVTVSSSEPLLSEAAYVIMARESFCPLNSFKFVLEGFAVHKGDRGEFLVLLLLTLARDQAVGPPDNNGHPQRQRRFFDFASFVYGYLFNSSSPLASGLMNLQNDFPDAKMHFNHFIKVHDFKSIDMKHLLLQMTRGAGVLCANGQASIDAVNVFLRSGTKLTTDNLGLIFYQIKNDSRYSHIPKEGLFESMNPYKLDILKEGDAPVPLIRIFFALAAKTSSLNVTRHATLPGYDAIVYDIWIAGLSPDSLKPIDRSQTEIWDRLLQASYGWKGIYKAGNSVEEELRRSMNPGAANDNGHWSRWVVLDDASVTRED